MYGHANETVDEYNSEAEEKLLQMKKKQKLIPVLPEEVERKLQLHLLKATVETDFTGTTSPEKFMLSPERVQLFTENLPAKKLGVIKTVVLACSKFKALAERRRMKALKNLMPRLGFSLGVPMPTRRIEIEDFGGDEDYYSDGGNRPLDVSLEMDDGYNSKPFHAEPDIIIPKVAQSLKELERTPTYYDIVKLTSS